MNGVSKKLTVAGVGIAGLLATIKVQSSILAYMVVAGIVVITLTAIGVQAYLDSKIKA